MHPVQHLLPLHNPVSDKSHVLKDSLQIIVALLEDTECTAEVMGFLPPAVYEEMC